MTRLPGHPQQQPGTASKTINNPYGGLGWGILELLSNSTMSSFFHCQSPLLGRPLACVSTKVAQLHHSLHKSTPGLHHPLPKLKNKIKRNWLTTTDVLQRWSDHKATRLCVSIYNKKVQNCSAAAPEDFTKSELAGHQSHSFGGNNSKRKISKIASRIGFSSANKDSIQDKKELKYNLRMSDWMC